MGEDKLLTSELESRKNLQCLNRLSCFSRGDGGGRLEVRGGRLEALAAGGGKAGSHAAQRMQNGETRNCTAAHFSRLGELFRIKTLTCSHSNSEVF